MGMVESNNKVAMFLNLVLLLCIFLIISSAESRQLDIGFGDAKRQATPKCQTVYGVQAGDTCTSVQEEFNLDAQFFAINPNVNCDFIFVGQWLCVVGTLN